MLFLGSGLTARAQSEDAGAPNGLEGTWRLRVKVYDCQTGATLRSFSALAAFAQGGTLTVVTAGQPPSLYTTGLGIWRHTQGHSYSAVYDAFLFNPAGVWIQTHRITLTIDIGDDGDTFTNTIGLEILDTSGNPIATGGCAAGTATRFK
jgi:hypothetical protein